MGATLRAHPDARQSEVSCPMCGWRYDRRAHTACAGCPMNLGCALSCCPRCGFSSADPSASALVRAFEWLRRRS